VRSWRGLEARNVGKPIGDARDEVAAAAVVAYYAGAANKLEGSTHPGGG
jgi:acyl-CoA reductase-like NAD-dependent aldehyde dehydrogenase